MESTVGVKHDLILGLRNQNFDYFCVKSFYRHLLEYLQSARSAKKNEKKTMCFSYGNAWPLLTFSRACGRWGRVFATTNSASLRP